LLSLVLLPVTLQPVGAQSVPLSIHVQGNQLLNATNAPVQFRGVNRSGSEYMCQGGGPQTFDGPVDQPAIDAMKTWAINVVRIPLNEDCWLGINGVPTGGLTSVQYQAAIVDYTQRLATNGIYAIVELHWSAPGTTTARGQQPMPDQDHSVAFWSSVATTFKSRPYVVLDLHNEPFPDNNANTTEAWRCLRDGGTCRGMSFQAAGMQQLVNTVRGTGATNVIMVPGVQYSNTLSHWLTSRPSDPLNQLAASWHSYAFNICNTVTCWDSTIAPVAAQVPLIAGEIGETDCAGAYITPLMAYLDAHQAHYLGWAWNTYDCGGFPSLISNYNGTPTGFGIAYRAHLLARAGTPSPTATSTPAVTPTATPTATTPKPCRNDRSRQCR
jgi:aryl-phospho-beta-D-glucosidase BglC (GH1 family)